MKLRIATLILALGVAAPAAARQDESGVATSFEQLRVLVMPGSAVTVTDPDGSVTSGRIASLSSTELSLLVDDAPRSYGERDVTLIRQRRDDSLANGARRGFWIGAGLFTLVIVSCGECRPDSAGGWAAAAGAAAVYGGLGAGIGVGFDAMVRAQRTVYRRPGATVSLRF